jgi:acyl-[acyl-carrier-protein] desaturase
VQRADLLLELEPTAAKLIDRHLATTKEWFPHELVPYSRGRDFVAGEPWCPDDADCAGAELSPAVRSALFVNLLTEDNLPYYFRDVERMFGIDGAWGFWAKRWTAEEGRHSIVLRDYLTVTRAIDPWDLERARMIQVSGGEAPAPTGPHQGLVYLCLQELATRISHRNTGKIVGDSAAYDVMARIAYDENLHHLFYRDLATAALEIDPSEMVIAINQIVRTFSMPGTGIPDFEAHAKAIAKAGIYDLLIHHDQILVPVVLRHWKIEELTGLTDAAEAARARLLNYIPRVGKVGRRLAEHRLSDEVAGLDADLVTADSLS